MNTPQTQLTLPRAWGSRFQTVSLLVGVLSLGLSAIGAFTNSRQFFFSYLYAWLFWTGLSLGSLVIVMIHLLTGGRWGFPTRRLFEAGFMVLPVMAVLFIPICFGLQELYPWARSADVAAETSMQARHAYMNQWAFTVRQALFFAVWIWFALRLRKASLAQDSTTDAAPTRRGRTLSGPGIVVFGLVTTFACMDSIMSLEKHWYSSIFAIVIMAGQVLSAYAGAILLMATLRRFKPFTEQLNRTHFHQLGNLLLTFVLFWTYVSFGQLLIMYSGDLPKETEWYLHRIAGNWKWIISTIALLHFFVPFFLLLFRMIKRSTRALTVLSGLIFLLHLLNIYWLVLPALHSHGMRLSWMDFTAPVGIGGVWIWFALARLKSAALLPQNDPGMQFAFVYAH